MEAFRAAVHEAVRPGAAVLDLGTGTGILAQWALEAGARTVYGIEFNADVLRTACERVTAAGHGERFRPVHGLSFDVELPERVDVVVSEIMGNLADNEGFATILADARRRFLAPGGAMLPRRVESYLVPVSAPRAHAQVRAGVPQDGGDAEQFAALLRGRGARSPFDLYYDVVLPLDGHLAAPRVVRVYDLERPERPEQHGRPEQPEQPEPSATYRVPLVFTAHRDGVLSGFKGYFVATLSDTVALDISGDGIAERTASDSWKHCYLPIEQQVRLRRGDRIVLDFERTDSPDGPFRQGYRWEGRVISGGEVTARFAHTTS
ncbi:class I SAM-dependent methyltransferase [Streptomyces sp. UNOC14_S4]|nr:class I SAM-dependent methyltransferase [Streptomyces sp. UNOC14_S4]